MSKMTKTQPDDAIKRRYNAWLTDVIDPLAQKHATTRDVIISILYQDYAKPGPTMKDAYAWVEGDAFAHMSSHEISEHNNAAPPPVARPKPN